MYQDRIGLYEKIEKSRNSKLIVYVTGDRRGLETQIHEEVLDFFVDHLNVIGTVPKISLYLYTRGGATLAAWSIANLIRQFCDEFEVLIPSKAHSAGTLICLGASTLVMTKQATLGPIDPNVNTPLNPRIPDGPPGARYSVSVEAINGFIELAKESGTDSSEYLTMVLSTLASHVHPLVLGEVYRTRSQIRMLGERLLSSHVDDDEKVEKILDFLCSESGSHDCTIYHHEARDKLGLNVETPSDELYELMKKVYNDIVSDLKLVEQFDIDLFLGGYDRRSYNFTRALIESVQGGSHKYVTEGKVVRRTAIDEEAGLKHEVVEGKKTAEGWKHEAASE